MEAMAETETPLIYDYICALWVLSSAMGRNVIVARPSAPVHLNMYITLVSESGILRKSSSIRAAVSILRHFMSTTQSSTLLIESKVTMGMLLNELSRTTREHGSSQIVLVASELAAMLGRGTQIAGIPALLTDLYDCPDERSGGGSLATGGLNFKNVYCSFLAGSTPSWLATSVRPEIVAGGFTSRCYFINGRNRKRLVAWGEEAKPDAADRLVKQLQEIQNESCSYFQIGINSSAKQTFTKWYANRPVHKDVYRESFESREDGHILRFAGLMCVNERAWSISDDHIRRAIAFVTEIKRFGTELFTGTNAQHTDLKLAKKVRNLILSSGNGGISHSDIYRGSSVSGRSGNELRSLLSIMHELDLITKHEIKNIRSRPRTMYVATEYLKNELFLEDVARKLGID
jgi:hypothetical protein